MAENWKKSQDILKDATARSEKFHNEIHELMEDLTEQNYKKIKKLLDKDSSLRSKALDKAQKICQKEIKKELDV